MQFSYFSKLSQREKYYIISGLVIVIGFFLYYFVWTPLSTSNQNLLAQINQQEELLHWMQAQQIEIKQHAGQQQSQDQDQEPLFTTVENSLQANTLDQLAIQLSSRDSDRVLIQIEKIEFDKLINWLTNLHAQYRITTNQATIHRIEGNSGFVRASVTLERI